MSENRQHFFSGAARAASHPLIFESSPECWQNAFPVGNGQFGGVVYQPDGTVFECTCNRLDIWKRHFDPGLRIPFAEIRRMAAEDPEKLRQVIFREHHTDVEPWFKPGGRMRLWLDEFDRFTLGQIFDCRQRLDLACGEVVGSYELPGKNCERITFAAADMDVMVTHLHDTYINEAQYCLPQTVRLELYRLYDPDARILRSGVTTDGMCYIEFDFREESRVILAAKADGVPWKEPVSSDMSASIELVLDYAGEPGPKEYTVFQTVLMSEDGADDLLALAAETLDQAIARGWEALRRETRADWQNFFDQSMIALDNPALEALWYNCLYQYGAQSRGPVAPGLFGLWNGERSAPWRGDYHGDINFAMYVWPLFALNRPEMLIPPFTTCRKWFPAMREEARNIYGVDALRFPLACGPCGRDMTPSVYRLMQCSTGFYADMYRKAAEWNPDPEWIRREIFPVLESCAEYYFHLTGYDENGALRIGPSWAPEQGVIPAWNTANDLGLIKPLWEAVVQYSKRYGIDSPAARKAETYLRDFPAYPQADGEFKDSASEEGRTLLCHPGYLACIVPGDDVDADSPLAEVAGKTLREHLEHTVRKPLAGKFGSGCDLTWGWMFCAAARLRDRAFAEKILAEIALSDFIKSNGMFAYLGGVICRNLEEKRASYQVEGCAAHCLLGQTASVKGRERTISMIQQAGAFLYGIMECLLQSHKQEIKLFPCILDIFGSDAGFYRLAAAGGLTVSARWHAGKTVWCHIRSGSQAYSGSLRLFAPAVGEVGLEQTGEQIYRLELPPDSEIAFGTPSEVPLHEPGIKFYGRNPIGYGRKGHYFD